MLFFMVKQLLTAAMYDWRFPNRSLMNSLMPVCVFLFFCFFFFHFRKILFAELLFLLCAHHYKHTPTHTNIHAHKHIYTLTHTVSNVIISANVSKMRFSNFFKRFKP